jgi:hypothetical protein
MVRRRFLKFLDQKKQTKLQFPDHLIDLDLIIVIILGEDYKL